MIKPLISIVIAVYNSEKYINKCFKSIEKQDDNYEVVIIDDGSTDNSGRICDSWAKRRNNVRVYHQHNQGISITRNNGIKYSKGEYIVFIDPDDWIDDEFTLIIQNLIHRNNDELADVVLYNYSFITKSNNHLKVSSSPYHYPRSDTSGKEVVKWLMTGVFVDFMWIAVIKKSIYIDNNIEFPDIKVHEDAATLYRLLFFAKKVVCTNKPLYNYFQRNNSLSHSLTMDRTTNFLQQFKVMDDFFLEHNGSEFISYSKEYKLVRLLAAYQNLVRLKLTKNEEKKFNKKIKKLIKANYVIKPYRKNTFIKEYLYIFNLLKPVVLFYDWKLRK